MHPTSVALGRLLCLFLFPSLLACSETTQRPTDARGPDTTRPDAGGADGQRADAQLADVQRGDVLPTHYGASFYVATDGDDLNNDGTAAQPFATLERARDAVRALKQGGLPAGGVVVWLRGGVYARSATFSLGNDDSGEVDQPVVYRGFPGETVRLTGGRTLDPGAFTPVTSSSPLFAQLEPAAQGKVQQIDLKAQGVTDYGTLVERGFGIKAKAAALELSFNGQSMTLARWPDADAHDPAATFSDATVTIYGSAQPDVSGTYVKSGTQDGVNAYTRTGLVGGKQYHLHRHTWTYQGSQYTAWFITTTASGYPGAGDAFWSHYDENFGAFNPAQGGSGLLTPNKPGAIVHGFVTITEGLSDTQFKYFGTRPDRWKSGDIWLHGYWKYAWADRHVPLGSLDTASKTITLVNKPGYGIATGQPFYAENLPEEITTPGEWVVDRASGLLYFWPPAPLAGAEIVVSLLETPLIELKGASHVVLQDLVLEAGRGELIKIEGGAHNRVTGCTLRNAGTRGATISGDDNGIERSEISGSGDGGVSLSGGTRASLTAAANFVRNCTIHHFGRWSWTYHPAVSVSGVGQQVTHNVLSEAPHSAIIFNGNEHLFAFNEIHHVCRYSSDAGAIYTGRDWGYRGNRIEHNFIHHISSNFEGYGVHGIYLDDCVSGIRVFGNVLYQISDNAVMHGGGRDNLIENNVMARCGRALYSDSRGLTAINNTPGDSWNLLERLRADGIQYKQPPWSTAYPKLALVPNDWSVISDPTKLWRYPQGCVFSRNAAFANTTFKKEGNYGGTGTFDKFAELKDNIEDQDLHFVDEAKLDLTLRSTSPALAIPGFAPIPFASIGIEP